ncbi:MAG: hypothetical protein Q9214_003834, partial [Letrouitia sp. 1 TL-2023]
IPLWFHLPRSCYKTISRHFSAPVAGAIPSAKQQYVPTTGTYPKGFFATGIHVGVKPSNTQFPDLALIASDTPCSAAAVFTKNIFQAAPVTVSREILQKRSGKGIRAIVINSGCANAVTGRGGLEDSMSMARAVDGCFANTGSLSSFSEPSRTLVMSTGVIGQRLPISIILSAIPQAYTSLSSSHSSWLLASRAICTTDTFPKILSTTFSLPSSPGVNYSLAGMTKGAGMIHPNMATLLGILATDAPIPESILSCLLKSAVDQSFHAISIDGDMSTNDTVAFLANGAAGGNPVTSLDTRDGQVMLEVLTSFAQQLSHLVVRDGEGATKFVKVKVINSPSLPDAKQIASTIAKSLLVKTALYGKDANWGRIICAIGHTEGVGADTVAPNKTSVSFVPQDGSNPLKLLVNGEPETVDEVRAAKILDQEDLEILVDLGGGKDGTGTEESSYWTCDLSHEYVTINADYRT